MHERLFRLKTSLRRNLMKRFKLNRPTGYPFITGDGFRALAEHFFDELSDFNPLDVMDGDIVYVNGDFLKEFFHKIHHSIVHPYTLISHNSDVNLNKEYSQYIDQKIIHWYAKNLEFRHEKATPIPIGLTDIFCNHTGRMTDIRKSHKQFKNAPKKTGMTFGFSLISHKERKELHQMLLKHPLAHNIDRISQADYFKRVADYTYVVSPEGNGDDCHRTWEALYLGAIPIVKRSCFTEYFENLGLPIILIDDWSEIMKFDEEFLSRKYDELKSKFHNPSLYIDYWMNIICCK